LFKIFFSICFLFIFTNANILDNIAKKTNRHIIDVTNFTSLQKKIDFELNLQLLYNIEKYFYCPQKLSFDLSNITNSFKDYWNDDSQLQKDTYNKCLCNHYILENNILKKYDDCPDNEKKLNISLTTKDKLEEFCLNKVRFKPLDIKLLWGTCDSGDLCNDNSNCSCNYYQGNKKFTISNYINKNYFDKILNSNKNTDLLEILKKNINTNDNLDSIHSFSLKDNYIVKDIYVSNSFLNLENKINLLKISLISENIMDVSNDIHIVSEFNKTFLLSKILTNDITWNNPCDNTTKTAKESDILFFISKEKNIYIYKLIDVYNPDTKSNELNWFSLDSLSSKYKNTRIMSGYCSGPSWNSENYIEFNECSKNEDCGDGNICNSLLSENIPEVRCLKNPNLNVYYTNDWFIETQKTAFDRLNEYNKGIPLYSNRKYYSCIQNSKNYFGNEKWNYWHRKTLLKKIQK